MKITNRKYKNNTAYWDTMTAPDWANTNPPWRPNLKEQKIMEKLIKSNCSKKTNCNIVLLGVTPEIRSILAKEHLNVDVVDYSVNMYATMSQFSQVSPNENYFQKDWIDFFKKSQKEKYDLILGDLVLRLITNNTAKTLMKYIAQALKKNGLLVLRVHIGKKHTQAPSFKTFLDKLNNKKLKDDEVVDSLFFPISEYFIKRGREVDSKKIRKVAYQYRVQKMSKKRKQILQTFIDKWTFIPLSFYVRTKFDIDKLMFPFFKKIHIYPGQYSNLINIHVVVWQKLGG